MTICSRCGASNPNENKFCGQCGQLLATASAIPPAPSNDQDLPDWLRDSQPSQAAPTPSGETSTPPAREQDLPAWLQDVGVPDEHPDHAAPTPDWLAQVQADTPPPAAATHDLPAWLQEQPATPAAAQAPANEPSELPDWLRQFDQPVAEQPPSTPDEPLPDWMQAAPPTAAQPQVPAAASGDALPDWLHELEASTPSVSPDQSESQAAATDPTIPAWLQEHDAPSRSAAGSRHEDVPPWLQDDSEALSGPPPAPQTASGPAPTQSDIPAWLRDDVADHVRSGDTAPVATADAVHNADVAPAYGSDTDVPPWLRDDAPGSESTVDAMPVPDWSSEFGGSSPNGASTPSDVPAWLQEHDSAPHAAPAARTPVEDADLPAWLRDDDASVPVSVSGTGSATGTPWLAADQPTQAQPMLPSEADLPDWLRNSAIGETQPLPIAATPSASSADSPPWLADEAGTAPATPAAQDDDLPHWLRDDSSVAPPQASPDPIVASNTTAELPAWLSEPNSAETQPVAQPQSDQELPSWLQQVDEPAPAPTSEGVPSWLGLPDEPPSDQHTARDNAPQANANVPPWLIDAQPVAAEPASASATPTDDLPPWLAEETPATPRTYDAEPANNDLPAWLIDEAPATPAQPADAAPANAADLPPWLDVQQDQPTHGAHIYDAVDSSASQAAPSPVTDQTTPAPDRGNAETIALPAWLDEGASSGNATHVDASSEGDLPPWLVGISEQEAAPRATTPSTLPSWLDDPSPAAPAQTPQAEATPAQNELLGGLDLPAWLREDQSSGTQAVSAPAPDWLHRDETEQDEVRSATPSAIAPPPVAQITRTPERRESIRLLEQLMVEPAAEPTPQLPKRRRSWLVIVLVLLVLLIIAAIAAALLVPGLGLNLGATLVIPAAHQAGVPVTMALRMER